MTKLRSLYRSLGLLSTKGQAAVCADLTGRTSVLAECFAKAIGQNDVINYVDQAFLPDDSEYRRRPISLRDRNDNRIYAWLAERGSVEVPGYPGGYSFRVIARQVPPLRAVGVGCPESGRGGVDYVRVAGGSPVLGEIKVTSDQNAFYAFVQLLVYLSEMATGYQIERAGRHLFKDTHISGHPAFDLHILLAERDDRGEKGRLIGATERLVKAFRCVLQQRHPIIADRLGNVLCLKLNTDQSGRAEGEAVGLIWRDMRSREKG
jgi:hypothetical protein